MVIGDAEGIHPAVVDADPLAGELGEKVGHDLHQLLRNMTGDFRPDPSHAFPPPSVAARDTSRCIQGLAIKTLTKEKMHVTFIKVYLV